MTEPCSRRINSNYLLNHQYKDAQNLSARARLHIRFSTNKYRWQNWLFDQFDLPPDARVIEFGTGPSWLWSENMHRIPNGWDITLTDFSPGMIDESKRNLARSVRHFKHEVVDIQSVPYADATFDAVIANHMLYHVPDLNMGVSEMRRILKPTGKAFTATNGEKHMREIRELQRGFDSQINYWEGFAGRSFELDNGVVALSRFFPQVELRRYPDALLVTEAQPLVDYILSVKTNEAIVGSRREELREFIQNEIDARGAIHITKDTGLLISSFA
jgi:SAM-dependent methyltransferase